MSADYFISISASVLTERLNMEGVGPEYLCSLPGADSNDTCS